MRRREFISFLCGAVGWPLTTHAQQSARVRRVGVIVGVKEDDEGRARLAAFQKGMKELGWNEGRDIQLDVRFAGGALI